MESFEKVLNVSVCVCMCVCVGGGYDQFCILKSSPGFIGQEVDRIKARDTS